MYQDFNQSFTRLGHVKTLIVHKTWAYQDSNKSSQVIGISVLQLIIIPKTWAYQLRNDQSFARLGNIKIPINHLQDIGISVLRLIIRKTWTYQDTINHLQDFGHIKTDRSIIRKTWAYQLRHDQSFSTIDRRVLGSILIRGMEI